MTVEPLAGQLRFHGAGLAKALRRGGVSISSITAKPGRSKTSRLLLSEDIQAGFTWRGVTVVNPFAAQPSPLLKGLLGP
jgi:hypothetical protein